MVSLTTVVKRMVFFKKGPALMYFFAKLTGGWHTAFHQGSQFTQPLGRQGGSCHGLSVSWLAAKRRYCRLDPRGNTVTLQSRFWSGSPTKVNTIDQRQLNGPSSLVYHATLTQAGLNPGATFSFDDIDGGAAAGIARMAWLMWHRGSFGNRYYLMVCATHTMAVTTSLRTARFFDPNGGEVVFATRAQFVAFLIMWLTQKDVWKVCFGGPRGQASLDIQLHEVT